ncbi:hypothetical protein [Pseudomonas sp. dw_358]|uniref:hypothetical protein n=1 Tax=Pseudomonas sp. dw_358 TaxID=2720083 RepID=UPI001BD3F209|nr:hypothetical protein [Pseudomonas sp. dw_358]
MAIENVFIAGFEKCGTTALADWVLLNGLAEHRVPGKKEPHLYANDEPHPIRLRTSTLPLMDASVGYATDPAAIGRLPQHDTRIVLCLRGQFERLWSAYKMMKIIGVSTASADTYFASYFTPATAESGQQRTAHNAEKALDFYINTFKKYFPRRSHEVVQGYVEKELANIRSDAPGANRV